jgi:cold shock CspA family protein
MLAGAGFFKPEDGQKAYVHTSQVAELNDDKNAVLVRLRKGEEIAQNAPIFVMGYASGSIVGKILKGTIGAANDGADGQRTQLITLSEAIKDSDGFSEVFVDFYVARTTGVTELTIDAANFGGYYYVEASTLFKREDSGKDMPAELVFPKVKIQSNFTFNMSSTGDPSTFSFVMDAFPDYTMFNRTKKVLCAIQIIEDEIEREGEEPVTFMGTNKSVIDDILDDDSNTSVPSAD